MLLTFILLHFAILQEEKSPFCTGRPVFTLAEPEDVDIICGEFDTGEGDHKKIFLKNISNSGIQLLDASLEPEQVFIVKKIINHPFYQPNRVCKNSWMYMFLAYELMS